MEYFVLAAAGGGMRRQRQEADKGAKATITNDNIEKEEGFEILCCGDKRRDGWTRNINRIRAVNEKKGSEVLNVCVRVCVLRRQNSENLES